MDGSVGGVVATATITGRLLWLTTLLPRKFCWALKQSEDPSVASNPPGDPTVYSLSANHLDRSLLVVCLS